MFASEDDGLNWRYLSRIDQTPAMPNTGPHGGSVGPCEPSMAQLADGRVLVVFRLQSVPWFTPFKPDLPGMIPLWKAYSSTAGKTWGSPTPMTSDRSARGIATPHAVWPQLLTLGSGTLVLASGRPGIGFWISPTADGATWTFFDVEAEHTRRFPDDPFTNESATTSYTGIAEVEPGVVLLAYDKIGAERVQNSSVEKVYSMRIKVHRVALKSDDAATQNSASALNDATLVCRLPKCGACMCFKYSVFCMHPLKWYISRAMLIGRGRCVWFRNCFEV